jgi:hypothetical protein
VTGKVVAIDSLVDGRDGGHQLSGDRLRQEIAQIEESPLVDKLST